MRPDLPGFGFSGSPPRSEFKYTFESLAKVIGDFTEVLGLKQFVIYIFDYGTTGWSATRIGTPRRIAAIISQNGNAYEEGLSEGWNPIQDYWKDPGACESCGPARLTGTGGRKVAIHPRRCRSIARCP